MRPSTLEVQSEVGRLPKKSRGLTVPDAVSTTRPMTSPPPMRYRRGETIDASHCTNMSLSTFT